MDITVQQRKAIGSRGKVIVSASAGSGKTFVMIQKLVSAIESGVDLDSVLAVTFTKKAAAQMKEKLRAALIGALADADKEKRTALKIQLSKIQSADISTIHSLCARLLRTYFYAVGIDGTFDIISSDDAQAREFKERTISSMFERYYDEDNESFKTLLSCYRRKRGDNYLKGLILSGYEELRINADYIALLDGVERLYTEEGFERVCRELCTAADEKYERLLGEVEKFASEFYHPNQVYQKILEEMISALKNSIHGDIFAPQLPISVTRKPADKGEDEKELGEQFKKFKEGINSRYKAVRGDICDRQTEKERFFASGKVAKAFAEVMKEFDREYTSLKRDENKLDYNDLEHLTLKLLSDVRIRTEINSKYSCVFVDEYQDVNPVQEEIISAIGGEDVFLVGDVKQAIYGFRGSKSLFFAEKYNRFEGGGGSALRLSNNFRSSDGVLKFVNKLFSKVMTTESCGFDYSDGSAMIRGGGYPENYGSAKIHIFGEDEGGDEELEVYSVRNGGEARHTREALAVLNIVEQELRSMHYDLKTGEMVDTQPGDICILTRKRNRAAEGIVWALEDAGYSVAGAQGADITYRPEVRQMLDILSYIDNKQQDIPLATALLSPIGGFSCDELAAIRVANKGAGRVPFRECCRRYIKFYNNAIAQKLRAFRVKIENLRDLAEVFTAAEMIDRILEDTYLEAEYCKGEKLKNIRRLAAEGEKISVSALLAKLRNGYEISSPTPAASDSIKIMTMHASKGLEFPVVIISDICATFKGKDTNELPLDENFGFAPKCFDMENKLTDETVLRKLIKERTAREELKNELNLFYVACTRAMCNLHILAKEAPEFNITQVAEATSYSRLFDISAFESGEIEIRETEKKEEGKSLLAQPDAKLYESINSRFACAYAAAESVNLPVKSSASAILRMGEEDSVCTKQLFGGEGETGTERGIAYHRFLELCDFEIKDRQGVEGERQSFMKAGLISGEQFELLDCDTLTEIVNMPVFSKLKGATLYREQEFLCMLPANEIMEVSAPDEVLIQGAIDLLVKTDTGYKVIDYKYSHKSAEQLIETYSKQLALYKRAVARITGADPNKIETVIVNIFRKEQINL